MPNYRTLARLLVASSLLVACETTEPPSTSSSSSSSSSGGGYQGACTPLKLGDTSLFFLSVARVGLSAPASPALPDMHTTHLTMELYEDDGSGSLPPLKPGTFSFAQAPDDNYGTCQHCLMLVGYDLGNHPKRAFYAKNGSMTVEKLDDNDFSVIAGSIDDAELVEVIQNPDLSWEVKPGGDCFYLDHWPFDTTPVDGGECDSVEQCPNETRQICDPKTGRCAQPQCSLTFDPPFCADGEQCLSQLTPLEDEPQGPAIGACYEKCDPLSLDSCGEGRICRPLGPTQAFGICLQKGSAPDLEPCTPADITSQCKGSSVCSGEPGVCAPICSFLQEPSGCPAGTFCSLGNLCEPKTHGDPAAIGDVCDEGSPLLVECGAEGDAFRGLCLNFFPEDQSATCERLCRTADPQCPQGEQCLGIFSNPVVGICRAPAVCGDGKLDLVGNEICDDGNKASGDGCSADCKAAEFGPLCALAQPLVPGMSVQGDTTGGPSGYGSSCDPYIATPARTFSFLPPSPGKWTVKLKSAADLGLSVWSDCEDPASERSCQNVLGDDSLAIQVQALPSKPLLVIVRGRYPLAAGAFTLESSFAPEVCGDGDLQGAEACDDGNSVDGDGCAADCKTIDWPFVCNGLPKLTLDTEVQGSTEGGTSLFNLANVCASGLGSGKERAFSFTAKEAGYLSLTLTQPNADLSLYVQDGCGDPAMQGFLACSRFSDVGANETGFLDLAAGQTITLVVDGFRPTEAGDFSLLATFQAY